MLLCLYCQDRYGSLTSHFHSPLLAENGIGARVQDVIIAAGPEIDGTDPASKSPGIALGPFACCWLSQ